MNNLSKNLIFNPKYKLCNGTGKVFLVSNNLFREKMYGEENIFSIITIHPIHAMMLSFFNGNTFNQAVKKAKNYLELDNNNALVGFLKQLVCNKDFIKVSLKDGPIYLPPDTIVPMSPYMNNHSYVPEMFNYSDINLKMDRLSNPLDIIINFTTKCVTDCIYCYADRREDCSCTIPLTRIYEIIDEAKRLDLRSIDVIGGEFLLYKHWYEVLYKLRENDFMPFLSTKIALNEHIIKKLSSLGIKCIQISLDSMIKESLLKSLQVTEKYYYDIQKTFKLLKKYNFDVKINTIISSANDSVDDIKSLSDFFLKFKDIIIFWSINYGEYSIYLGENKFKNYKAKKENITLINKFIRDLNQRKAFDFEIGEIGLLTSPETLDIKARKKEFENRAACGGNLFAMYILPDGKVTICEELYWNPNFIIGDITKQSISEVWNSEKARKLFYLTQDRISDDSACKTCEIFDECRGSNYKKICWRDTVKCYGHNKWDYPDHRCPIAPKIDKYIFP